MGKYPVPKTEEERLEQEKQKKENKKKNDETRNRKKREATARKRAESGNVIFTGDMAEEKATSSASRKRTAVIRGNEPGKKMNKAHEQLPFSVNVSAGDNTPLNNSNQLEFQSELHNIDSEALEAFASLEQQAFIYSELEHAKEQSLKKLERKRSKNKNAEDLDAAWQEQHEAVFRALVASKASLNPSSCTHCSSLTPFFHCKCLDCSLHSHVCHSCDFKVHFSKPFHNRAVFKRVETTTSPFSSVFSSKTLLPTQFVDSEGCIFSQDVPIPLIPSNCHQCQKLMTVIGSITPSQVVMQHGRFDLRQASFLCELCCVSRTAALEDYIRSDYWPGNPNRLTFFVKGDIIRLWYQLKFTSPTTSLEAWLESLSAVSAQDGRGTFIKATLFAKACKAHDYYNFLIDKEIKNKDPWSCRPCSSIKGEPAQLEVHIDGDQKLIRLYRENERKDRSWYDGELFVRHEEFSKFNEEINAVKPQATNTLGAQKKSLCGNSNWQAAKEVSKRYKNMDETGVVTGCCGHGVMQAAVNMKEGETYRHTLCIQQKIHKERKAKFVVNDVVCKYWPFLLSLISLLPGLAPLYNNMKPFLSRLHGQAHAWYCQALWFGHWLKGAAGILGEEMEQVFSWFSRFFSVTHRMTSSNRIDHLTQAAIHWNARKEPKMALLITRRLLNAIYKAKFYEDRLKDLLLKHNIKENELSALHITVQEEARAYLDKHDDATSHLTDLQRNLEGLHFEIFNLEDMISSVANTCKWRTKLIARKTKLYHKATAVIDEINDISSKASSEVVVTDLNFKEGIFPWDPASKKSFKVNFRIVDCWMLRDRNREQITQSHTEMSQLLRSLERDIVALQDEMNAIYSSEIMGSDRAFQEGCALLKAVECSRLKSILADALTYSKYYTSDSNHEFDTCLDLDSDEDEDSVNE